MLDTGAHLSALAADSEAIADLASDHLDARVPACPEWAVADLVGHQGGVYSWTRLVVEAAGERPTGSRARPPESRDDLMGWFLDRRSGVLDALSSKEPDQPAWSFVGPATVGWWRRRQAMETAIHLHDLEEAVGRPGPVATELAADGVDEMLTEFLVPYVKRQPIPALSGTLHLHATDTDGGVEGEWTVDFRGADVEVRRDHAKADAALRGPASGLFLWVWNRITPQEAGLEVFGNAAVVDAWRGVAI